MATPMTPERFQDRFEAYQGEPQQVSGIWRLYEGVRRLDGGDELLTEEADWARKFSEATKRVRPNQAAYCYQVDNGPEGWRQCQTSAIAMALIHRRTPGILDDLDYLKVVSRYGDTTVQESHKLALKALGVPAVFTKSATLARVKAYMDANKLVPMGVLHHGPVTAPSGGGHWIAGVDYSEPRQGWHVHDPYGELDLVKGGWARRGPGAGKGQLYSYRNLNPRLTHGGEFWAWFID